MTTRRAFTLDDMPEALRREIQSLVASGDISLAEVTEALAFYNELADAEMAGDVSPGEAMLVAERFAEMQVAKGPRA